MCRGCRSRRPRRRRRPSAARPRRRARPSPRARAGPGREPDGWYGDGPPDPRPRRRRAAWCRRDRRRSRIPRPRRPPYRPAFPMADDDDRPYTTYKARPRFLQGRGEDDLGGKEGGRPEYEVHGRRRGLRGWLRRGGGGRSSSSGRFTVGRILRFLAFAVAAWVLVSAIVFLISAQIQESKISSAAERQLSSDGFTLTSPNTVLLLGSDARPKGTKEAGANVIGSASRSDSILLMRVGGGANATLSIPRDTVVDIPGHGRNKINAAYALGGPSLAI